MNVEIPLLKAQKQFIMSKAPHPAISGGLGCVHGGSRIITEYGFMRMCDITSSIRVLSWNEKCQRFQLSLSGGAFPKGKENLTRILTRTGELRVSEQHLLFSYGCKYRRAEDLTTQNSLLKSFSFLYCSSSELGLLLSLLDVQHCSKIDEDCLRDYADEARRYGQQLHEEAIADINCSQEQDDVHTLPHTYDPTAFEHKGGIMARLSTHIRLGLSCVLSYMQGYVSQNVETEEVAEGQMQASFAGRILHYLQQFRLSLQMFVCRRIIALLRVVYRSLTNSYLSIIEDNIIEVSVEECNSVYYDMQVMGTNNYVCENGFIHHNSGKTEAGVLRHVSLMVSDLGINTLIGMPTYDLLRLRAIPCAEEILTRLNIKFNVNKSEYSISVLGYGVIYFRSYDRPERWVSFEVAHTLLDELDTLPIDKAELVWRKSSERTRQKCNGINTIAAVTSPDQGINGFIGTKWGGNENTALKDGYELIFADTRDNHYLPNGYVDQIMKNYDDLLAEIYISGRLVSLNRDKVYHYFNRNRHHTDRVITNDDVVIHVGIDFNIGGCCANAFLIESNEPIAVDEFSSYDTRDFINNLERYKGKKVIVYPDASGGNDSTNASASDIELIENAGYTVDSPNKNPFVRDRVNAVNSLLSHNAFKVNTDKCPQLTIAFESQGYDDKGQPEKNKTHPSVDDWLDNTGYFINRKFPVIKPVLFTGIGYAR